MFMGFIRVLCDWKCRVKMTCLFTFVGIIEQTTVYLKFN